MASNDLNQCNIIGRLVEQPELRHSNSGTPVCTFTLANGWKTKEKDGTEYIRCVAYQRTAEVIAEYMGKGDQMFISGRMSTRSYEKDGQKRYSTEITVNQMQMLAKAKANEQAKQEQPKKMANLDDDIPW